MAAPSMAATGRAAQGGFFFTAGVNSLIDPLALADGTMAWAVNAVNRGGIWQTRPGYRSTINLVMENEIDWAGNLQGMILFKPLFDRSYLVFAVDGRVYVSRAPFTTFRRLENIQFRPGAAQIFWTVAQKYATRDSEGVSVPVDPYPVLMMQDGYTRAAFWDGSIDRHLDPSPGVDETPMGSWMAWSGDRLWVARNNRLYAGDIGDPLAFTETIYQGVGGSFILSEDITGMAELPDRSRLVVFTDQTTTTFLSSQRTRSSWSGMDNFQEILFDTIGCVSGRSIVSQYGLLWWFSAGGLVSFDSAYASQRSSLLLYKDNEMMRSKGNLSPQRGGIAGATFENYLLMSVPSGDLYNRHTWVMDQTVIQALEGVTPSAWNGIWTGTRPVEWASGIVDGVPRVFYCSKDYDGMNRIWEAFQGDRSDNGRPITVEIETKLHFGQPDLFQYKRFSYADMLLTEIAGDVDFDASYIGTHGCFKPLISTNFEAIYGSTLTQPPVIPIPETTNLLSFRPQDRYIRTVEPRSDDPATSVCGIESVKTDNIDFGFGLYFKWSGHCGLRAYQISADPVDSPNTGQCPVPEVGDGKNRTLTEPGCKYAGDLLQLPVS